MTMILDPPHWKNGPRICPLANLPCFETEADIHAYRERYSPGSSLDKTWRCEHCRKLHAEFSPRPPSGASSGGNKRKRK